MSALLTPQDMIARADKCDSVGDHATAEQWRKHAAECAQSTVLGDRVAGWMIKLIIGVFILDVLAEPAFDLLVAFGEVCARWLA